MSLDTTAAHLLRRTAHDLSTDIPVDVVAICQRLGLRLEVRHKVPQDEGRNKDRHKGSLLEDADGNKTVVVFRRTAHRRQQLSPYERIVVAHEIAHCLLIEAHYPQPARRAEYWATERLCEDFAYWLLLGNLDVDLRAATPRRVLAAAMGIAHAANVTFKLSARACVERYSAPGIVIGDIEFSPLKSTHRLGYLLWLFNSSGRWLEPSLGRRAIYEATGVADFFTGFFDHPRSTIRSIPVVGLRDVALVRHVQYGAHFCADAESELPGEPEFTGPCGTD